jgi:adenylylsulfate kinase
LGFEEVKSRIEAALWRYRGKFIVMKIPNISHVFYGRDVGYVVERLVLDDDTERVSATDIRRELGL